MERSDSIKGDKGSIDQFDAKQKGKKLASSFLAGDINLADEIKAMPPEQQGSLKQGIFDVLISMISLPVTEEDEKRIGVIGKGMQLVISGSEFSSLYKQLSAALSQYLKEAVQYEEAIRRQYAPKLRQKEEELSRRIGREVRIDPFQDPEFVAFYNQNMGVLKNNYQTAIDQGKEEIRRLFEKDRPA